MANLAALCLFSNAKSQVPEKSIILFDGVCNMCGGFVKFILPRDHKSQFVFGSLQSTGAQQLLLSFRQPAERMTTVVLIEHGQLYVKSDAVLRILKQMGGGWALLYSGIILPLWIRDGLYDLIAKHRYRLFGKKTSCLVPRPEWKDRFMD